MMTEFKSLTNHKPKENIEGRGKQGGGIGTHQVSQIIQRSVHVRDPWSRWILNTFSDLVSPQSPFTRLQRQGDPPMLRSSALFISGPDCELCGQLLTNHCSLGRQGAPPLRLCSGGHRQAFLHSYLQKSFSPLGRWSPSMASL